MFTKLSKYQLRLVWQTEKIILWVFIHLSRVQGHGQQTLFHVGSITTAFHPVRPSDFFFFYDFTMPDHWSRALQPPNWVFTGERSLSFLSFIAILWLNWPHAKLLFSNLCSSNPYENEIKIFSDGILRMQSWFRI